MEKPEEDKGGIKMKKHYLLLLIVAVIYFFPVDVNIMVNKALGWGWHIVLWGALAIFVLYNMKGKNLKEKWNNFTKQIKINSR